MMDKVIAKGLFGEVEILVEATIEDGDLVVDFNGEEDAMLEPVLMQLLKYAPAMGGVYYPPVYSLLNVVNVLENGWFFTKLISLETEGEEETIPFDEDELENVY